MHLIFEDYGKDSGKDPVRFYSCCCRVMLMRTCLFFLVLIVPGTVATGQAALTADAIVTNMVRAYSENRAQLRPYVLTRKYVVLKGGQQKSTIVAAIIHLPPEVNTFEIRESTGGKAEGVIRKLLDKEMQLANDFQATGFNITNYDFQLLGEEVMAGTDCYVLSIRPRRKTKDLLDGKIWVDKGLYLVRRAQGSPAKNPSWWVKEVSFTLDYSSLNGMWLQTGSSGDAQVRFAGKYSIVSKKIAFALLNQ